MTKLLISGTLQIAEVCAYSFDRDSDYEVVAHTADGAFVDGDRFGSRPVGPFEDLSAAFPPHHHHLLHAVGYSKVNRLRADKFFAARALGYRMARYVSSK